MDKAEITRRALEARENLETVIATAAKIHSPLYARWLREMYNLNTGIVVLSIGAAPEAQAQRDYMMNVLMHCTVEISLLALTHVREDLAKHGKNISEENLRKTFATDLEGLLKRVWSGDSFAMSIGGTDETDSTG